MTRNGANIAKRDFFEIVPVEACIPGSNGLAARSRRSFIRRGSRPDFTTPTRLSPTTSIFDRAVALVRRREEAADLRLFAATYGRRDGRVDDPAGSMVEAAAADEPLGCRKHAFDLWALRQAAAGSAPPHWAGSNSSTCLAERVTTGRMMSLSPRTTGKVAAGETIRLFQVASPGLSRWRAAARLRLCEGLCRGDVVLWHQGRDSGILQYRQRRGAQLSRSDECARHRLRQTAEHRICRHPAGDPAELPILSPRATLTRLRQAATMLPFTPLEAAVTDLVTHHLAQSDPYL